MKEKALKDYVINADLKIVAGITIKAESMEDALMQSREFKETKFITFKDEWIDGSIKITGVFENE